MKTKSTSKAGEAYIKPFKQSHKNKIKEGLERLRIGGTHEEAAAVCGLRPDQTWKRMSELEKEGEIFDTGIRRKLKSGLNGIVWQLKGMKPVEVPLHPKTQEQLKAHKTLSQLNLYGN